MGLGLGLGGVRVRVRVVRVRARGRIRVRVKCHHQSLEHILLYQFSLIESCNTLDTHDRFSRAYTRLPTVLPTAILNSFKTGQELCAFGTIRVDTLA